jgi:hypothetical protein
VVRKQEGEGFLRNAREFFRGFLHSRKFGKDHADDSAGVNAYREAGEIIGTSAMVWAAPWYTVRACVALVGGLSGLQPAAFTKFLISTMSALEGLDVLLAGVETALVERILRRNRNDETASKPEPEKPKSGPEKPGLNLDDGHEAKEGDSWPDDEKEAA